MRKTIAGERAARSWLGVSALLRAGAQRRALNNHSTTWLPDLPMEDIVAIKRKMAKQNLPKVCERSSLVRSTQSLREVFRHGDTTTNASICAASLSPPSGE